MSPEQRSAYKFNTTILQGDSDVLYRKAVARLYGDHTGDVIFQLGRDPFHNLPVIIKRIEQKNAEWRSTQTQLNIRWREMF